MSKTVNVIKVISALVLSLVITAAYAAEPSSVTPSSAAPKIGVLDMQQVMQQAPEVAKLNKQLQTQFQPRQEKIKAAQKQLQEEMAKFSKNASVMSNTEKTKQQDKIIADRTAFQGLVQSYQQDLSAAQSEAMQKFMGKLQTAVDNVAKKDNYTLIIQHAAVPYMAKDLDVTPNVIKEMSSH